MNKTIKHIHKFKTICDTCGDFILYDSTAKRDPSIPPILFVRIRDYGAMEVDMCPKCYEPIGRLIDEMKRVYNDKKDHKRRGNSTRNNSC